MGVDPTKFGRKLMPLFTGMQEGKVYLVRP